MDTSQVLREYGLSEKEAQTYLALLPLGKINLQEIAKRVDLPRTTIYNTLNYLISKGLVSFIMNKGVRFYEATDPK
jgi:HTH-type transcriptional regulator, sugar sensing transcriptional regulator